MNQEPLRVLIVEDSASDTRLLLVELRRGARPIEALRVDNERDLRAALVAERWDLVLSDWSLPGFDALHALEVVRELTLDLPFIIVSGTVGEDKAADAMRAGANDYVLKDRLTRLRPAIERELRESQGRAEHRAAAAALRRSEDQLRQAMKMEAVGRLAAGVAHDFNNLLSVILGYGELVLARLQPTDPIRHEVQQIDAAAERAAQLTRQLLQFSRQHVLKPQVLDVNELLSELDRMLRRVLAEDIELRLVLAPTPCLVHVDRGSLEQVIMNLVVNARDAMPQGGKLTIETERVNLDEEYARAHLGTRPGLFVRIAMTDTGIGMDTETQVRIFEPFFTTKEKNVGTGLGLSTALGIVQQSEGSIWVYSEPGVGTTFKVFLPFAQGQKSPSEAPQAELMPCGTETILLVEDESAVRAVAARILANHGYQVLEANGPVEALMICESHEAQIDLLLTDVVMPKMAGPALAAELTLRRPGLKVLYMSGYTDDSVLRHGVLHAEIVYLQKPLTTGNLTRKVREALER